MSRDRSPVLSDNHDSESSSADDEVKDGPDVESLVTGREKRATAGNRLSSLLEREGDDELELLFAENEEEEDIEFEEEESQASDAELDTSTDEEDQTPAKADDELAGEKELQKQDRLERQKKRKAHGKLKRPGVLQKKVKIDSSANPVTPAPRPKKKSERVSWVHSEADAPSRASSRKQTVQNREVVQQRLAENEQARLKVMQQMEEAQKRKDAAKPKALTQADRLEEAAKTERRNAKSLNRWEESEKKRAEEQRAKLEALHNRQLTGPAITWWSGLARWVNGKVAQLGVKEIRGAGHIEKPVGEESHGLGEGTKDVPNDIPYSGENITTAVPEVLHPHHLTEPSQQMAIPLNHQSPLPQQFSLSAPHSPYGFLDGIHAYAALPAPHQRTEFAGTAEGDSNTQNYSGLRQGDYGSRLPGFMPAKGLTTEIEFASRTLVALKNIDANAVKLPELQSSVLLKKPRAKLSSEF